jgi:hypothetical protein
MLKYCVDSVVLQGCPLTKSLEPVLGNNRERKDGFIPGKLTVG